jgi:3-hydroxybutyryl-CoA dehydratase
MTKYHSGIVLEEIKIPAVTKESIQEYAAVSNDKNSIHLDQQAAEKAGFSTIVAHGMIGAALSALAVERWIPEYEFIASYHVRFQAPHYVNESLLIKGTVLSTAENRRKVTIDLKVETEQKNVILKGEIVVQLRREISDASSK